MKKKYIYSSAATVLLTFASYHLGRHQEGLQQEKYQVAYVNGKQAKGKKNTVISDTSKMSPDEVSLKEGIAAEQIVVKITDQGYVTSHGDHYHYYNGKVPYDAIISEELIFNDEDYVLDRSDIVNEVKDGYIIKLNGQYYLYLKDKGKAVNVRTKEEIQRQRDDSGYLISDSIRDREHSARRQQMRGGTSQISVTKAYTTDDGYVFNPSDVIDDLGDGFLVPHGDHFHFIPKADLSADELASAQAYWNERHRTVVAVPKTQQLVGNSLVSYSDSVSSYQQAGPISQNLSSNSLVTQSTSQLHSGNVKGESLSDLLQKFYALPLSSRYVEADGLVFDPLTITKRTEQGVVVPHGDHYHFIPFNRMSALEEKISRQVIIGSQNSQSSSVQAVSSSKDRKTVQAPVSVTPSLVPSKPLVVPIVVNPEKSSDSVISPVLSLDELESQTSEKEKGVDFLGKIVQKSEKGRDGKAYTTSDGYIFTAESILAYDDQGLRAGHGDHEHYIFYHELEDWELEAAETYINRQGLAAISPSDDSQENITAKLHYISLENGVPIERLSVTGNQVIIPHGNHSHIANLERYPIALRMEDYEDLEEYRDLLITLKMSHLRLQEEVQSVYRRNDLVMIIDRDGSEYGVNLADIKLPLVYEEVDYSDLVTELDSNEEKLVYIAKQYGVPRHEVVHLFGDLVMVGDLGAVNLRLVDVNEEVIYSLQETSSATEEEDWDDWEEEVKNQEEQSTESDHLVDRAALIAHLGNFYGDTVEQIGYVPRIGFVLVPVNGEENTILSDTLVKASLSDLSLLPSLLENNDPVSVEDHNELTEEETKDKSATEEILNLEIATDDEKVVIEKVDNPEHSLQLEVGDVTEEQSESVAVEVSHALLEEELHEESVIIDEHDEWDEYDRLLNARAQSFGLSADEFEDILISIALRYGVSLDHFTYLPESGSVSFYDRQGEYQVVII